MAPIRSAPYPSITHARTLSKLPANSQPDNHIDTLKWIVQSYGVSLSDFFPQADNNSNMAYCKLCREHLANDGRTKDRHTYKRAHIARMSAKLNLDPALLQPPPFSCEVCGETLTRKDALTRHMKRHSKPMTSGANPIQRTSSLPTVTSRALRSPTGVARASTLPPDAYNRVAASSRVYTQSQSTAQMPHIRTSSQATSIASSHSYPQILKPQVNSYAASVHPIAYPLDPSRETATHCHYSSAYTYNDVQRSSVATYGSSYQSYYH